MCYSAMMWADYRSYVRFYGAIISITEFVQLFKTRLDGGKVSIPRGMEDAFMEPETPQEAAIKAMINDWRRIETARLEGEIFKQRTRLAEAERQLRLKETKRALEDKRIATMKIEQTKNRVKDLKRSEPSERDCRVYPGAYAPVMIEEGGQLVVKPMRYQCRLAGKPSLYDRKYPGTYNARRDNLEGFWSNQFGATHGLMVATAFFENVSRHRLEGRELKENEEPENVILKFEPTGGDPMQVACLYSHWTGAGEPDLWSFAAITDDPPPEIAAAGHDRCIIPIMRTNVGAWLRPEGDRARSYRILDERERPYYEHQIAA